MGFSDFLKASGLGLPSPAYLIGMLLFSLVGWVAWRHGRRTQEAKPKWLGAALMFYSYVTPQTWLMWLVGAGLCGWLYFVWE